MKISEAIADYLDWKAIRSPRAAIIYKTHLVRLSDYFKMTSVQPIISDSLPYGRTGSINGSVMVHPIICSTLQEVDTKTISNQQIVSFVKYLESKCNPPTVAYSCRIIKNFFSYLNAIQESTIHTFLIQEPKYTLKERIGVSEQEFKAMCDTLNPWKLHELQKLTILHILHDTGIRVSELCGLTVDQISSTENYTAIKNMKNNNTRYIMWSMSFHKNTFLRWLGSRISLNQDKSLFLTLDQPGRKKLIPRTVERWIEQISKKAGITKRIFPHMFRHAKAHYMRASGADLKDIQLMLGHVSTFSALRYLNYDKNEMLENAKKYLEH